jgi:hypothetical protein
LPADALPLFITANSFLPLMKSLLLGLVTLTLSLASLHAANDGQPA